MATIHHLKCENPWFEQIWNYEKRFEVRRTTDRTFAVDDRLYLYEYDKDSGEFSSRLCIAVVTSICEMEIPYGVSKAYQDGRASVSPGVIMSINVKQKQNVPWPAKSWREGQPARTELAK